MLHPEPGEEGVRCEPPEREAEQQHVQQLGGGHRVTVAMAAHLRRGHCCSCNFILFMYW